MAVIAVRAKNPLNIRPLPNGQQWSGQIGVEAPHLGGYCKFPSWQYGIRACAMQLLAYQRRHGKNTIREIIERWAPASDGNHVGNYVSRVSRLSGYGADDPLNLEDWEVMDAIFNAMAYVEIGLPDGAKLPYTRGEFLQGLELARFEGIPQDEVRTAPLPDPIRRSEGIGIGTVAAGGGAVLATIAESQGEIVQAIESAQSFGDLVGGVWPWAAGLVVLAAVALVVVRKMRSRV